MNKEELIIKLNQLKNDTRTIGMQIETIKFAVNQNIYEENGEEEKAVQYDENKIIEEYIYREKEVLFFIKNFLDEFMHTVSIIQNENKDVFISLNTETVSFYFDSLVSQLNVLLEAVQREQLEKYFENDITNIYPSRSEIGLWWETYFLRNKIMHCDVSRYSDNKNVCQRYQTFSSKNKMTHINEKGQISMPTTLIDIYKNVEIQRVIEKAINCRDINPFDLLFLNTSAKGHSKRRPYLLYIDNDIFFDYVTSGSRYIGEIMDFFEKVNAVFFDYLLKKLKNKEDFLQRKVIMPEEDEKIFIIGEVFSKILDKK